MPRVVVKVQRIEAAAADEWRCTEYQAFCRTGDCGWAYAAAIRAVVEEQARFHRQQHRREVDAR